MRRTSRYCREAETSAVLPRHAVSRGELGRSEGNDPSTTDLRRKTSTQTGPPGEEYRDRVDQGRCSRTRNLGGSVIERRPVLVTSVSRKWCLEVTDFKILNRDFGEVHLTIARDGVHSSQVGRLVQPDSKSYPGESLESLQAVPSGAAFVIFGASRGHLLASLQKVRDAGDGPYTRTRHGHKRHCRIGLVVHLDSPSPS